MNKERAYTAQYSNLTDLCHGPDQDKTPSESKTPPCDHEYGDQEKKRDYEYFNARVQSMDEWYRREVLAQGYVLIILPSSL